MPDDDIFYFLTLTQAPKQAMPSTAKPRWDNETKTPDRERPFHRIRYKDFDTSGAKQKADGDGLSCGCSPMDEFKDIESAFLGFIVEKGFLRDVLATLLGAGADGVDGLFKLLESIPGVNAVAIVFAAAKDMLLDTARKLHPKAVRAIPQWVAVNKTARNDLVDASQVVEIEGFVTRAYQSAIEPPLTQWRHFYSWNLDIRPERGYEWVEAVTPNPPSTEDQDDLGDDKEDKDNKEEQERAISQKGSVQCQWDGGALWQDRTMFERDFKDDLEANTFGKAAELACGPMFQADWAWPMTGQYAWAAGRWVFDCSKTTKSRDKNKKPKMCSMLHPCKAVATARWRAFKFPQNEGRVPAIQFMFFACKRGGYLDYDRIDDQDYEFIVDLPEIETERTEPLAVGRTNKIPPFSFDHNTIVLRPRLLKHFDFEVFSTAGGARVDPIVQIIQPDTPDTAPRQAKITIPMTKMQGAESYGVIVTLGWFDPTNVQALRVRHVTVRLLSLTPKKERDNPAEDVAPLIESFVSSLAEEIIKGRIPKTNIDALDALDSALDILLKGFSGIIKLAVKAILAIAKKAIELAKLEKEEWLLRAGVNGRWVVFHRKVKVGERLNLGQTFELFLDENDRIDICLNGGEIDDIGEVLHEARGRRVLMQDGRRVPWTKIAKPDDADMRRNLILAYILKLMTTWANENEPLGFIDPRIDPNLRVTDYDYGKEKHNPLWMDEKPHPVGANASAVGAKVGSSASLTLTAKFARAVGGSQCVYVEDPAEDDYVLEYDVSVAAQDLPKDAAVAAQPTA